MGPSRRKEPYQDKNMLEKIREVLLELLNYGYRRVWAILCHSSGIKVTKKKVQQFMKLNGLQAKMHCYETKRRKHQGRVQVKHSDLLWATDMTKVWCGKDGWASLFGVIDCCDREIVGFCINWKARDALCDAVSARFGSLKKCGSGPWFAFR